MAIRLPRARISNWLSQATLEVATKARIKATGKSGAAQGRVRITSTSTVKKGTVTASKWHLGRPPFDTVLKVPTGGFDAGPGKAFRMIKPEGRVVFRRKIYTKFSGQTIQRKGFLSEAMREVMGGAGGVRKIAILRKQIVSALVVEVANEVVRKMLQNGVPARRIR